MRKILFTKFANDRNDNYKIRTTIYEEAGKHVVEKQGISDGGKKHLKYVASMYPELKKVFTDSVFEANKVDSIEDGINVEFVSGNNMANMLTDLLAAGNRDKFLEYMDKYQGEVRNLAKQSFSPCEEYFQLFGADAETGDNLKSMQVTDIDMIFDNIVISKGKWIVLDYEWTINVPVPVDFVLYRAAHYYKAGHKDLLEGINLYEIFGITEDKIEIYKKMEEVFQEYVFRGNKPLWKLYEGMGRELFYPSGLVDFQSRENEIRKTCILKADSEGKFLPSEPVDARPDEKGVVRFDINVEPGIKTVVISPASRGCNIYVQRIIGVADEEYEIAYGTNGKSYNNKLIFFDNKEPQIWIGDLREGLTTIHVEYAIDYQNDYMLGQLSTGVADYNNLNLEKVTKEAEIGQKNVEIKALQDANAEMRARIEALTARVEELTAANDAMLGSFSWKVTKPVRSIKKAVSGGKR